MDAPMMPWVNILESRNLILAEMSAVGIQRNTVAAKFIMCFTVSLTAAFSQFFHLSNFLFTFPFYFPRKFVYYLFLFLCWCQSFVQRFLLLVGPQLIHFSFVHNVIDWCLFCMSQKCKQVWCFLIKKTYFDDGIDIYLVKSMMKQSRVFTYPP